MKRKVAKEREYKKVVKRRTRKDKIAPKHNFTISWDPSVSRSTVKSQKSQIEPKLSANIVKTKNATNTVLNLDLASMKRDLLKSLLISLFIVIFEVVIYFFWK